MAENATEWFYRRATPIQKEKIKRLAERKGATQKAAVLNAVEQELSEYDRAGAQPESVRIVTTDDDFRVYCTTADEPLDAVLPDS